MRAEFQTSHLLFSIFVFLLLVFCLPGITYSFEEYTITSQSTVSAGEAKELRVITPGNLGGQIVLQVWDKAECLVKRKCWAKAKTQEKARDFIEMVEMDLEMEDEVVTLKLTTPHPAPWEGSNYGIQVSLSIFIPQDFTVETNTQAFDLELTGPIRKADVQNRYGNIRISDVSEETNITASYSQVEVKNVEGSLNIKTSYNSILAQDIYTKDNKAYLKTSYGKINIERFEGQLEANTVYDTISASDITLRGGRNEIETVYSKIDLDITEIEDANLYVKNTYGNINVLVPDDLSAYLMLNVGRGGKIRTRGIIIQPITLNRTTLEGTCGEEDSEIEIDIEGIGQIILEGR